jgi:hypothetical protein
MNRQDAKAPSFSSTDQATNSVLDADSIEVNQ